MYKKSKIKGKDLRNRISKMSREEKVKMLLDYAKECYKKGYKPTKRGIRKKFHLEIYNYFRNIADYHEKAGIPVALRYCPREKVKEILINYIQQEIKSSRFPNHEHIEKKFNISIRSYFKNFKDFYKCANIDYSLVKEAQKNKIIAVHKHSKATLNKQRELIKEFIQNNVKEGIYPSVQYIQKILNLKFYNLYNNIFEAYKKAGVNYYRPSPILLGRKKEEVFTKIVKEIILKMGFKIKRVSLESKIDFNRNADMAIEDKSNQSFLVEIKAYRKDYHISKREFLQLVKYLKKEHITQGIFITTSNTKKCDFVNIRLINGNQIKELLKQYKLSHYIKSIEWVQEARVNSQERKRYIELRKKELMDYIKAKGFIPTKKEIEKTLKINLNTLYGRGSKPYEKLLNEVKNSGALRPTA